jgi:hypothetical protein
MLWSDVCKVYPNTWVVVEALSSHQIDDEKTIDEVMVLDSYSDSATAWSRYKQVKQLKPQVLIASTVNAALKVKVQRCLKPPFKKQNPPAQSSSPQWQ